MEDLTTEQISDRTGFDLEPETTIETPNEVEEAPKEEVVIEGKSKGKVGQQETEAKTLEEGVEIEELKVETKPEERQQRTVPYGKLKHEIQKRKVLEEDIQEIKSGYRKMEEMISGFIKSNKPQEGDPIQIAAKEIAEKNALDENMVSDLLKKATELSSTGNVTKELANKISELENIAIKDKEKQQAMVDVTSFNGEWESYLIDLKKQYPNATESMLKEAKIKMDEIAHSKAHNTHELDYILWKEKQTFDSILKIASKSKSGETGKQMLVKDTDDEYDDNIDIENLTPEIMKIRESKRIQRNNVSRNDDIRIIEKL